MSLEERAKEMAGNWKKIRDFSWYGQPEDVDEKWSLFYYSNRDADSVTRSNAKAFEALADEFPDDVIAQQHSHCAVGHVDGLVIRVYDKSGEITPAFIKLNEMLESLEDYPVLDDNDLSDMGYEEFQESWNNWGRHKFEKALENSFELNEEDEELFFYLDVDAIWTQLVDHLNYEYEHTGTEVRINIKGAIEYLSKHPDIFWDELAKVPTSKAYLDHLKGIEDTKLARWKKDVVGHNPGAEPEVVREDALKRTAQYRVGPFTWTVEDDVVFVQKDSGKSFESIASYTYKDFETAAEMAWKMARRQARAVIASNPPSERDPADLYYYVASMDPKKNVVVQAVQMTHDLRTIDKLVEAFRGQGHEVIWAGWARNWQHCRNAVRVALHLDWPEFDRHPITFVPPLDKGLEPVWRHQVSGYNPPDGAGEMTGEHKGSGVAMNPQTSRVSGTATRVWQDDAGNTHVRYHNTDVVSFNDRWITLRTGGYKTVTTKARMNQASNQFSLGYGVFQRAGEWHVDWIDQELDFSENILSLDRTAEHLHVTAADMVSPTSEMPARRQRVSVSGPRTEAVETEEEFHAGEWEKTERNPPKKNEADVVVRDHGSVTIFMLYSGEARDWWAENVAEGQQFGGGYVVEPRYADPIMQGMQDAGLTVRMS